MLQGSAPLGSKGFRKPLSADCAWQTRHMIIMYVTKKHLLCPLVRVILLKVF